jgi:hypothetical protein
VAWRLHRLLAQAHARLDAAAAFATAHPRPEWVPGPRPPQRPSGAAIAATPGDPGSIAAGPFGKSATRAPYATSALLPPISQLRQPQNARSQVP